MAKTLADLRNNKSGDVITPEASVTPKVIEEHSSPEPKSEPKPKRPEVTKSLKESIKNESEQLLEFKDGNKIIIQPADAKVMLDTYTSLSESNQVEMNKMLNESLATFSKAIFFSFKHARESK